MAVLVSTPRLRCASIDEPAVLIIWLAHEHISSRTLFKVSR